MRKRKLALFQGRSEASAVVRGGAGDLVAHLELSGYSPPVTRPRLVLGSLLLLLAVAALTSACMWPLINDVTTGQTPEYPELQPQRFGADLAAVYAASLEAAKAIGLEIISADEAKGEIRGVATTRILRFKDDVTITISREGDATVVNIRSASRIGRGDFGANARRIGKLQAEIASRL